jgi:hypothetical protein
MAASCIRFCFLKFWAGQFLYSLLLLAALTSNSWLCKPGTNAARLPQDFRNSLEHSMCLVQLTTTRLPQDFRNSLYFINSQRALYALQKRPTTDCILQDLLRIVFYN